MININLQRYTKEKDSPYISKDFLQGDDVLYKQIESLNLSYQEVQEAINVITNKESLPEWKKLDLLNNMWKVNYKVKPPSMKDFLTPKYIGAVADKLFPHVKKVLIEFMNPIIENKKRVLALSSAISWGKSTCSAILILYIILHFQYMRDCKKFFNLNEMGSFIIVLLSFTQKKANQVLMKPFINLLKSSPIFHAVRMEERLPIKQTDLPIDHIAYTTAGRMGSTQFSKDIHISVISDRADFLGLNIIAGIASEISFFIQRGVSPEEIWLTYTDLRERINSRFAHAFLTATILDSSPLDLEVSPIDKYLYGTGENSAINDPEVMIVNAKHWDVFPEKYPIWSKTKESFFIFRGNSGKPPKILENEEEKKRYHEEDIYEIPIDAKIAFQQSLKKSICDLCAYPSGGIAKLFDNMSVIENIFSSKLRNQYFPINIPEEKEPKKLIWNQIKDTFFINVGGRLKFYRSSNAQRTIHIDLSETGDISGLGMSHLEYNRKGEIIVIHDFLLPLHKGKSRINIDAVCEFILDLRKKGGIKIFKVTADQYQSATILQRLRRLGFDAEKLSVDKETGPYFLYASWIKLGKVKAGKSIHLKNNLKSLQEVIREKGSKKIDHIQGNPIYEGDMSWDLSQVGYRAKDISDTACGSAYILISEYNSLPTYTFDERVSIIKKDKILSKLSDQYNLKLKEKHIDN